TSQALLYYTLNTLGLHTDPSARAPQDQQIVLLAKNGGNEPRNIDSDRKMPSC
ncbi:MAG TPA: WYL domain-containing protein, partial [Gammaproteobacteria bacterium]|nr:WYL domain-containing protein [Gammaproteobacteria bacterium]